MAISESYVKSDAYSEKEFRKNLSSRFRDILYSIFVKYCSTQSWGSLVVVGQLYCTVCQTMPHTQFPVGLVADEQLMREAKHFHYFRRIVRKSGSLAANLGTS